MVLFLKIGYFFVCLQSGTKTTSWVQLRLCRTCDCKHTSPLNQFIVIHLMLFSFSVSHLLNHAEYVLLHFQKNITKYNKISTTFCKITMTTLFFSGCKLTRTNTCFLLSQCSTSCTVGLYLQHTKGQTKRQVEKWKARKAERQSGEC